MSCAALDGISGVWAKSGTVLAILIVYAAGKYRDLFVNVLLFFNMQLLGIL